MKKTLSLKKTTLRDLDNSSLNKVAGGDTYGSFCGNNWTSNTFDCSACVCSGACTIICGTGGCS